MDCRTARSLLTLGRLFTSELEASEAEALDSHLADCPECRTLAQGESRVDDHLRRAMNAVPVPEGLRSRLLARLQTSQGAWHRRRWVRYAGSLAAAAAVALAVWLGMGTKSGLPVPAQWVADNMSGQIANPSPDTVQFWYQQRGVRTVAPPSFNYALLSYYDLTELQGERVPILLFIQNNRQARVYILSERFDLRQALSQRQEDGSGCKFEVRPNPADPHVAYLVVYTGDTLEPFLSEDEPRPAT